MEIPPEEVIVLGAVKEGAKKFDKIKKKTSLDPENLNQILEKLEKKGLIRVETKKGFFGPKISIYVTEDGKAELENQINIMENNWKQMSVLYKEGNKQKLQQYMEDNKTMIPMMMFFGIMDIMFFSTMLGFLGMQMTDYVPADQIPEGAEDANLDDGSGMADGDFDIDIGF